MIDQRKYHTTFTRACIDYWRGSFDFTGYTSRGGFLWIVALYFLLYTLATGFSHTFLLFRFSLYFPDLMFVFAVFLIPIIALTVRRFRDVGLTFISTLLWYSLLILILYTLFRSNYLDNQRLILRFLFLWLLAHATLLSLKRNTLAVKPKMQVNDWCYLFLTRSPEQSAITHESHITQPGILAVPFLLIGFYISIVCLSAMGVLFYVVYFR